MFTIIIAVISVIFASLVILAKWINGYWGRQGIPYIPAELLFGNIGRIVKYQQSPAELFAEFYNHPNAINHPVVGIHMFHKPCLVIREPEIIRNILVKDFNQFSNKYTSSDIHTDPIGGYALFFSKNPIWRMVRTKLTPTFTSGKMKLMHTLVQNVAKNLNNILLKSKDEELNDIDIRDLSARYTTDVITSSAFGVDAKALENPNGDFRATGKEILPTTPLRGFVFASFFFLPQIVPIFKFQVLTKKASEFLRSTVKYVMEERLKSGQKRYDLIDTLLDIKNEGDPKWNEDFLVSQVSSYFAAGTETSSSLMSFTLYELAKNPHLQDRLRQEIKEALEKNNGEINYDTLQEMKFLHMVCDETLRLYPPLAYLDRVCSNPDGYSLKPHLDYTIPYNTPVLIPDFAIHRDPKYFRNPMDFDPERFSDENKRNITPYSYMPFGVGPRNCIGERFGYMSAKMGLVYFLRNHKVVPSSKTPMQMKLDEKSYVLAPKGGIRLNVLREPLLS